MRTGTACACILALLAAASAAAQSPGLTLDQACGLADGNAEAIRAKELALQKSRLAVKEAVSRALPRVDMEASASYLTNPSAGYTIAAGSLGTFTAAIPAGAITIPGVYSNADDIPLGAFSLPKNDVTIGAQLHEYFSVAATLTQPLFTWGKIGNAIDAARLQVDAAASDLSRQRRDVTREVRRAYSSALLARESRAVLQRLHETAGEILADRRKALDGGSTNREPVLDAAASRATIEAKLTEAEQGNATALEGLGMLVGMDPSAITLATGFTSALPHLDETALLAEALRNSPDMADGRTRMSLARKKLAIERGGAMLLPDVALAVSFDLNGQEDLPDSSWSIDNGTWSWNLIISLGMKMSVFDGLSSAARIGEAERDVELTVTGLAQTEKLVRLAVRKAVDAVLRADAGVTEKQARVDLARERLRNARASFETGAVSRAEMRGADILEGSAELELLLALFTREEALADVARLAGALPGVEAP